jgi:hypothetical protein
MKVPVYFVAHHQPHFAGDRAGVSLEEARQLLKAGVAAFDAGSLELDGCQMSEADKATLRAEFAPPPAAPASQPEPAPAPAPVAPPAEPPKPTEPPPAAPASQPAA